RIDQENALLRGLVEKITDQVNNLSATLPKMSQAIERLSAQDNNASAEVRVILANLKNRMNELQSGLYAIQTQIGSVSDQITAAKTTVEPLPGPEDLMRAAAVDALAGNYDLAVGDYMDFLSKYP